MYRRPRSTCGPSGDLRPLRGPRRLHLLRSSLRICTGRPRAFPFREDDRHAPDSQPVHGAKYFLVVILLFLLQTSFGGSGPLHDQPRELLSPIVAAIIPYSWAKSWHLQLAHLLDRYHLDRLGHLYGSHYRRGGTQEAGVARPAPFCGILVVAGGSLLGEIAGIKDTWGTGGSGSPSGMGVSGAGRLWQILLFIGLIAWLLIVYRLWPSSMAEAAD